MDNNTPKKVNGFKSQAQMERCRKMVEDGSMTKEQFDSYHAATDHSNLVERIHPKKDK